MLSAKPCNFVISTSRCLKLQAYVKYVSLQLSLVCSIEMSLPYPLPRAPVTAADFVPVQGHCLGNGSPLLPPSFCSPLKLSFGKFLHSKVQAAFICKEEEKTTLDKQTSFSFTALFIGSIASIFFVWLVVGFLFLFFLSLGFCVFILHR